MCRVRGGGRFRVHLNKEWKFLCNSKYKNRGWGRVGSGGEGGSEQIIEVFGENLKKTLSGGGWGGSGRVKEGWSGGGQGSGGEWSGWGGGSGWM